MVADEWWSYHAAESLQIAEECHHVRCDNEWIDDSPHPLEGTP